MKKSTINILLFSFLFFLAGALAYGSVYYLLNQETKAISVAEEKIQQALANEKALINTQALLVNTQSQRNELDRFFVESDGVVDFLETIEALGSTAGVDFDVSSVEIRTEEVPDGGREPLTEELLLTTRARGTFSEAFHFLTLVEDMPLKIRTEQLNLNYVGTQEEEGAESIWQLLLIFSVVKES